MTGSMPPLGERARWGLIVLAGALVLAAIHVWWIVAYRHGYPMDVDEAGYTAIGVNDYIGFKTGGLDGWWQAFQSQAPNAPLVPAITSAVLLIKPGVLEGFGVLIAFLVLLAIATYGIGERLAGPRLGALSALIVVTAQGAFSYTREYVFALPVGALLACAIYAVLRSEGMRSRRWAAVAGLALGLMVLARTMAVAFVPGVLIATVAVAIARSHGDLARRALNLGLMIAVGFLTAAMWYWRNLQSVMDYLTSYGYGAQSNYYGAEHALFSWERFRGVFDRMIYDDLLLPMAVLLTLGLLALIVMAIQRVIEAPNRGAAVRGLLATDAFAVGVAFLVGYGALMSTQNAGNGFTYPLTVLLPPLAALALRRSRIGALPIVVLAGSIAVLNIVANSNLSAGLSRPRYVDLPILGSQPWISGVPNAVGAIRVQVPGPEARFADRDKGWTQTDQKLVDLLVQPIGPDGEPPVISFASRNRSISTNSVGLAALLKYRRGIPLVQLNAEPDDSVRNYIQQLANPAFPQTALVTMSTEAGDFPPVVTQSHAETAARRLGFERVRSMALPDGRTLHVWVKREPDDSATPNRH